MENLIVRCSELHKIMTKPRSKSEEISETTKTYLKEKIKQEVYGYDIELNTKPVLKGIHVENESIKLVNAVYFKRFSKNTERKSNEWLTGEPDIVTEETIEDIKSSWTIDTFPAFKEDAESAIKKAGYDWQLRGYMMLFDKPKSKIHYCMVSTPSFIEKNDDIIYLLNEWDNTSLHKVDHIYASLRVSSVEIERDLEIEREIIERYEIANKYYKKYFQEITNK